MRIGHVAVLFGAILAGCGQANAPATPETTTAAPTTDALSTAPWVICDAIDAPSVLVFRGGPPGGATELTTYDKPHGGEASDPQTFTLGASEGAAGSIYTALSRDGAEVGAVRQINPGMLETPATAYTPVFTSVHVGGLEASCRWLPRTRLMGFSHKRSFVISEDADGDLIYTTFDFDAARNAQPVELSSNARSTTFSVEVRSGEEAVTPTGAEFRFANHGYRYVVIAPRTGEARIEVYRGETLAASEPLVAFITGDASQAATP